MPYPKSDHHDGRVFFNTDPNMRELKGLTDVIKWRLGNKAKPWPEGVPMGPVPDVSAPVPAGQARVTMVNHACLLVQLAGVNLLTDPLYSERASPTSFAGPKRVRPPGIPMERLPKVDVVVVSHNHYDHLDTATLKRLWERDRPKMIVPLGTADLLAEQGIEGVTELDWWQSTTPNPELTVTLTEAQHWSARGVFDRNRALWGGYVLSAGGVQVFFAGDTGYGGHFASIRQRLGHIDVALLPIGAYEPRWFMRPQHMNPEDAVRAHLDLGAAQSVGIHFGTFQLTDEAIDDPPKDLAAAMNAHQVAAQAFVPLLNGEGVVYTAKP